ncbi:MAG: YggT family protein [Pseudanabaena sp.]
MPSLIIVDTVGKFLQIYSILLIIRILLTWFPNVDWYKQPFATLSQVTDPYLNLFRSIIPPLGGMDFSPILAFLALNLMQNDIGLIARNAMGF